MSLLKLLASNSFITVNKELVKIVGLEEAILLGELISELDYWENRYEDNFDGWFYSTIDNVESKTTLSGYQQRKALKKLTELNLVECVIKGMPSKRYVKINDEQVLKLLKSKFLKNLRPRTKETKDQGLKKLNPNNNIDNNNIMCLKDVLHYLLLFYQNSLQQFQKVVLKDVYL